MSKYILAIDTAGHSCSVAIVDEDKRCVFQESNWMSRGHAAALAPLMQRAIGQVSTSDIAALTVTRGPGGFTGMRAGLAYARAFSLARAIPIYGLNCFSALRLRIGSKMPCLIDTRRGDFFYDQITAEIFDLPPAVQEGIGILSKDQLHHICKQPGGSIWQTQAAQNLNFTKPESEGWIEPSPKAMAAYGLKLLKSNTKPNPKDLVPLYVRAPSLG